jgi:shikimate kinase
MLAHTGKSLLFLIGARGTGKTTLARLVAEQLGSAWCDADALLEQRASMTIRAIFASEGEAGFRDRESAILREVAALDNHVVATGGGVVLRPENRDLLRRGHVVWLQASPAVLWQRICEDTATAERRPNLAQGGLAEVESLLQARTPLYAACADLAVDTERLPADAIAQQISAWLNGLTQ